MKKFIILFLTGIIFSYTLKGQCNIRMNDIYTPEGSLVVTFLMCESSNSVRDYWDKAVAQDFPNARQIETYNGYSSTRKFNCHGYAWLRVDRNIDRWIGTGWANDITEPEDIYITDGSYIEVPQETYPGKVAWASGDHSAVTTSQPGRFISKWNEYPLVEHAWNDSPYGTSNLKYYKKKSIPTITGSSQEVCGYGTFTLLNPPAGVGTIYWKVSNTSLFMVNPTGNPTTVYVIGSGNDIGRLSAHSGSTNGPTLADIVIVPCTLRVASTAVRAYPNPVSDMLTIDIDKDAFVQAKVAAGQTGIATSRIDLDPVFDIRLLDRYGNVLRSMNTQDSKVQIDATDLSEGMYYLYVYSGKGTRPITHKIIVGH